MLESYSTTGISFTACTAEVVEADLHVFCAQRKEKDWRIMQLMNEVKTMIN